MRLIERRQDVDRLLLALDRAPVVLMTGPRQVGKSTLAREVVDPPRERFFDLEDPRDLARLAEPMLALADLEGPIVIDEAQRQSDLFPVLRVLADKAERPGKFLVLGSASPHLVGLGSESLAGRVTMFELAGLRIGDLDRAGLATPMRTLWSRGGLPASALADSENASNAWRDDYIATFLERDLANLGFRMPATTMRRFWTMVAHYHGQTWNGAELARSMGISQSTVGRYLDALTDALVLRQLQPWFVNTSKRQVRSPKVYIRDSGLLHRLLGINNLTDLFGHPKAGASWEGFVIEQILGLKTGDPSFWATHNGAELDLLLNVGTKRIGVEVKLTDAPKLSRSMRIAMEELELAHLYVVYFGDHRFNLAPEIEAISLTELLEELTAQIG